MATTTELERSRRNREKMISLRRRLLAVEADHVGITFSPRDVVALSWMISTHPAYTALAEEEET
jgi:hypothetical protein